MKISKLYEKIEKVLTEREKEIIKLRYGLTPSGYKTQREIAQQLDISRSYVSRIEKKALKKLKRELNIDKNNINKKNKNDKDKTDKTDKNNQNMKNLAFYKIARFFVVYYFWLEFIK